jgi:hypothetical protein
MSAIEVALELTKHHAMKTNEGVEGVQFILNLGTRSEWSALRTVCFMPWD